MEHTRFIGLDIHKQRISIAVAESGRAGSVEYLGEIANDPDAIGKLCERLGRSGKPLAFCYEAGPCGYGVHRQLPRYCRLRLRRPLARIESISVLRLVLLRPRQP
jgi:transposase